MKPRRRQIADARVGSPGLLTMTAGAVMCHVPTCSPDVFDRAFAFAERWDHPTPGAYAARACATAHRARCVEAGR